MKNIFLWKKEASDKKNTSHHTTKAMTFNDLSKPEQEKTLKKGAEDFSKRFTKIITKLANE